MTDFKPGRNIIMRSGKALAIDKGESKTVAAMRGTMAGMPVF